MWHEARKQERMIRGMIVDYRRRAERRKDFYEKIKAEPTQFLQLHARPCKIHLDPAVAAAGEGSAIMMPWQGDTSNMIDRFDVRAHLDFIPEVKYPDVPPEDLGTEERQCNYERYRILAQNVFLGISEDKFLRQLAIEEQFGVTIEEKEMQKERLQKKGMGAAIGYNYNDPGAQPSCSNGPDIKQVEQRESDDDSDLEIIDVDLSIDVNKMEASQAHELNGVGPQFGMAGCDLFSFLTGDADDAEHQKQLLREEKEKAMFSGRKSRRERRAHRDKKLATRVASPPSYAAPAQRARSPSRSPSRSASRSASPDPGDNIQFITSFGGDEEEVKPPLPSKPLYSEKVKKNLKKMEMLYSEVARKRRGSPASEGRYSRPIGPRGPDSRSRSGSLSPSRSRSRSRSPARSWRKSRSFSRSRSVSSKSRSKSYSPSKRSRSRSRSRTFKSRRSRSPANNASGYAKRNNSRSMSYESVDKGGPSRAAVPRYYGRRREDKSSSELSLDSDSSDSADDDKNKSAVGNKPNTNQNQLRFSGSSSKGPSRETLTLKEKLKRKMQTQLSRQLRADKRAEAERVQRESRRQARRDEEMRELAIKLRRKQREMRHQQHRRSSDDSDRSRSGSSSRDSAAPEKRSRSKSQSPDEKQIPPVWETNRGSTSHRPPLPGEHLPRKRYQEYPDTSYALRTPTQPYYQRESPPPEKMRDIPRTQSRSRSQSPRNKRLPVWETNRDATLGQYRPRPPELDNPHYQDPRKRYHGYPEEKNDEERPQNTNTYPNRYDKYPKENPRYEHQVYDNRWTQERSYHPGRRPYGPRGGYRGHGLRQGGAEHYGDGPSWYPRESQDYDRENSENSRNKVKLVDY